MKSRLIFIWKKNAFFKLKELDIGELKNDFFYLCNLASGSVHSLDFLFSLMIYLQHSNDEVAFLSFWIWITFLILETLFLTHYHALQIKQPNTYSQRAAYGLGRGRRQRAWARYFV